MSSVLVGLPLVFCTQASRVHLHDIFAYVDTLDAMRRTHEQTGRWLHHRRDAHPNPEGHEVIADAIVQAGFITPME